MLLKEEDAIVGYYYWLNANDIGPIVIQIDVLHIF